MQPRLMRSRTEVVIAGVCGGIGEYFSIDPVIVRLIFVLVGLTTWGLGVLLYPILWLIMPKAPALDSPASFAPGPSQSQPALGRAAGMEAQASEVAAREVLRQPAGATQSRPGTAPGHAEAPPPPSSYNFDPLTGQPIRPGDPAIGDTVLLRDDPTLPPAQEPIVAQGQPQPGYVPPGGTHVRRRRRWPVLGVMLLGIGLMGIATAFGIPAGIVFPILMILAGVVLLRRR